MPELSYILPLRWEDDAGLDELTAYLRGLARSCDEVIVVDGSASPLFERHALAWHGLIVHIRPDPRFRFVMPKVDGVLTGVTEARNEMIVVADDDVRYDENGLARVAASLEDSDLVWPQNYFDPLPWHAVWDTGRTLLNRAFAHDYPGTVGVRSSALLACGGYDGDVMFENLELRRTIEAAGGRIVTPLDLFVRRMPPSSGHFWSQRVRQAYDDLALPGRLAVFLAIVPGVAAGLLLRRLEPIVAGVLGTVILAEVGRRRAGGAAVFPARASLFAPAWVLERAVTSWLAVWQRVAHGGVSYRGRRIKASATSRRVLRERLAEVRLSGPTSAPGGSAPRDRAREPRRSTASL